MSNIKEEVPRVNSATYTGKCAALLSPATDGVSLGLVDGSSSSSLQLFTYVHDTSLFHPNGNLKLCLAVGATSRSAGSFMSRSLELRACNLTESKYKQWKMKGGVDKSMQ